MRFRYRARYGSPMPALLPGTPRHQAILGALVDHYAVDPRIGAVTVFGSVGRGDWHALSDLDLDVIVSDGVLLDPADEVRRLDVAFERLGEHIALVVPRPPDEAKVVLVSLMQLSVRFHPLRNTSPNIRSGLLVLCGSLAQAEVEAAADANARATIPTPMMTMQSICICDVVGAESALARALLWLALDVLHQLHGRLMHMFCETYGFGERPIRSFPNHAPPATQELLASTQASAVTNAGVRQALHNALDVLEYHLPCFAGPGATLSQEQQVIVTALRTRLVP